MTKKKRHAYMDKFCGEMALWFGNTAAWELGLHPGHVNNWRYQLGHEFGVHFYGLVSMVTKPSFFDF